MDSEDPGMWLRVIRVDYGSALVSGPDGPVSARAPFPIAVGDWVRWSDESDGEIIEIAARRTQVTRRDASGLLQVLAANVDLVFVAVPADRVRLTRAEREVTVGWDSGAQPIVLLTKADLDDGSTVALLRERLLGVDVIPVSVESAASIDAVRRHMQPELTAVLLGPSGAGKSTLVNALIGREVAATGDVREGDRRGRHTTVTRELHALPGGGFLIDSPGLRSLALAVESDSLMATFPEIAALASDCRFRDCTHLHEPGCAVTAAVARGELDPGRLENLHRMSRDLAYQLRRDDPIAAQAHEAMLRQRRIEARRISRERGSH